MGCGRSSRAGGQANGWGGGWEGGRAGGGVGVRVVGWVDGGWGCMRVCVCVSPHARSHHLFHQGSSGLAAGSEPDAVQSAGPPHLPA